MHIEASRTESHAMSNEVSLAIGLLFAITVWLAFKHIVASHRDAKQRLIAHAGETCYGRVVAIQRPFLLDDCTRLYFDFVPSGSDAPIRACHVARSSSDESPRPLPPQGAVVTIRYLPEQPQRAVIGKLVAG
jgi:hypothetical protein